ncbi:RNA recognition motif RNP 1 [Fasciola gigantica]|uniref:RNA recognition motif RNP 1 n=1 Tax=Fasciola gigantica TaxID=46835 RepID=A0A504X307_FASGI|nr:RNA recognition motif RNP 1 [Fasciola gigantica]
MPDLSSNNKQSTKSSTVKKTQPAGGSVKPSVASKGREPKRSGGARSDSHSPPRRRRVRPRSRSSASRSSDSSSDSNSAGSSDSHSSRCGREPPKKISRTTDSKVDRSKPTKRSSDLPSKGDVPAKPSETKVLRDTKRQQPGTNAETTKESSIRTDITSKNHTTDATSVHSSAPKLSTTEKSPVTEVANKDNSVKVSGKSSKDSEADRAIKNQGDIPSDLPKFTCVLVEKLTRNVNKAHVSEIFSVWGEIEHVDMPSDRLHPEFSRSYAYVHYRQPKSAMDAVNYMNGGQIDGEVVRVTEVLSKNTISADSRNAAGSRPQGPPITEDRAHARDRDRETVKTKETEKPLAGSTRPKDDRASVTRRPEDASATDRQKDHKPNRDDDREPGFDRRRDARMRERERDRLRDRDRERERRERDRDRSRPVGAPRRARRGSSGSPFASRSGGPVVERQRSPAAGGGSRYRRPSPPAGTRTDRSPVRRGRSRTPPSKPGPTRGGAAGTGGSSSVAEDKNAPARRGRRATSRSSSSSSSDSSSSSSSSSSSASSGSRSGSASSSSSSTSRSRS